MSLGTPSIGTSSNWYSQYDNDITALLKRIEDNNNNNIDAKDVRDALWSLYNDIQTVSSQSSSQSVYTLATPSTIDVGGFSEGDTFSNYTFKDFYKKLLLPYVEPQITSLTPSKTEYEFGSLTPFSISYNINVGSVDIQSIEFEGPQGTLSPKLPTGSDPDIGTKTSIVPTYSNSSDLQYFNIYTCSVITTDSLSFSATTSIVYKNRKYYGSIDLSSLGGFTPSSTTSVNSVKSFITDSKIKGLSYSSLSTTFNFDQDINFNGSQSYFVYAAPTSFGDLPEDGFYVENMFTNDFTLLKDTYTFSNANSYKSTYNVWISNNSYGDSISNLSIK